MPFTMNIEVEVLEDSLGGAAGAKEYLARLKTRKVMFVNGPESPQVCPRCLSWHGTVWSQDSAHPMPPLHDHCFCRLVSYREPEPGVRSRAPRQRGEFLKEQVTKMSLREREILMGKGIARLHRLGIIESDQLVTSAEGILTLEAHLLRRLGISAKQYRQLSDGQLIELFDRFTK